MAPHAHDAGLTSPLQWEAGQPATPVLPPPSIQALQDFVHWLRSQRPRPRGVQLPRGIVDRWPTDGLQVEQVKLAIETVMEYMKLRTDLEWIDTEYLYRTGESISSHTELHVFLWEDRGRVTIRWMGPHGGPHWADGVMSFARTVLYLTQLDHPYLAKLHGLTWDGRVVLEHSRHGTLSQVLASTRHQVPPQQRLAWAMQVADALQHLHSQNPPVVHCDLKTDSILIDIQWNAKLADFGGSLQLAGMPEDANSCFTPSKRGATTKEGNVYSFGILLGLLATNTDPETMWDDFWHGELLKASQLQPPEGLHQPHLQGLIARCMDQQPEQRPNIGEVLEGLRLLEPEGILPRGTWPARHIQEQEDIIIPYGMLPDPEGCVREQEVSISLWQEGTWLDHKEDVMRLPAARADEEQEELDGSWDEAQQLELGPAAGEGRSADGLQAVQALSGQQVDGLPPQQEGPAAPSTPQRTQPHITNGPAASVTSAAAWAHSLIVTVGRWPDMYLRESREEHKALVQACMHQLQEKLGDLWIEAQQLDLGPVVGEGGFADVLRAVHKTRGQQVALKLFHVFTHHGRTKVQSFVKEVCLLSQLEHKNIVTLHHFTANLQRGWLGLVLEWAGDSLAAKLAAEKGGQLVITSQQRLEWAIGMAEGLLYLHGQVPCIVHRDLTPWNVLVDQHDQAKLIDLGISQLRIHTHLTVNRAGCSAWMAPELISGQQKAKGLKLLSLANEKSDIYSFGLCLGAMATHCQPWEGHDGEELNVALEFMHGARLDTPQVQQPWLQQLIQQCMREEPGSRPAIGGVLSVLRQHSAEGILRSPGAWPVRQPDNN